VAPSTEEILTRLLLLWLPLVPLGCSNGRGSPDDRVDAMTMDADGAGTGGQGGAGGGGGSNGGVPCGSLSTTSDATFTVARMDAKDPAAWDKCAASGDCTNLCREVDPIVAGLITCQRVEASPATDGGATDGGADRDANGAAPLIIHIVGCT
jgi:hypothetical protein